MADDLASWFDWNHPMNQVTPHRYTVDELEKLLQSDDEVPLQILPNGEIVAAPAGYGRRGSNEDGPNKPLTYRENLGGEYGERTAA